MTRYFTADEYIKVNDAFEKGTGQILSKIGSRDTTPDIFHSPQSIHSRENSPEPTQEQSRNETNVQRYMKQLSKRSFVELLDDGNLKWTHDGTHDWAKTCLRSVNTHILFNIVVSGDAGNDKDALVPLDEDRSESEVLKQWADEDRPQLQALDKGGLLCYMQRKTNKLKHIALELEKYNVFLKFGYFKMTVMDMKSGKVKGRALPFVAGTASTSLASSLTSSAHVSC